MPNKTDNNYVDILCHQRWHDLILSIFVSQTCVLTHVTVLTHVSVSSKQLLWEQSGRHGSTLGPGAIAPKPWPYLAPQMWHEIMFDELEWESTYRCKKEHSMVFKMRFHLGPRLGPRWAVHDGPQTPSRRGRGHPSPYPIHSAPDSPAFATRDMNIW